jgi:wyosine [tRNA(Phe)-imidazoG37] synthetase (radical SAM superfamily)
MSSARKYIFGPVPSRRLGLSLGIDIVPFKTCTQNCVYCQLGRNAVPTNERKAWVPAAAVLAELKAVLNEGVRADHITISGSGEPTLNSELGILIDGIKIMTDIPVAVITNGTLLTDAAVRADCAKADVVLPSLDAGDEATFRLVNKPHESVTLATLLDGLCAFRSAYKGLIWLEVFIVEGVNTSADQLGRIRHFIDYISPDKVHLNTAVRPTAERGITAASPARMEEIALMLGSRAEVIADFGSQGQPHVIAAGDDILSMLRRRPCSLQDICNGTGLAPAEAQRRIALLLDKGVIEPERRDNATFFRVK